jgi:hypothetical protein
MRSTTIHGEHIAAGEAVVVSDEVAATAIATRKAILFEPVDYDPVEPQNDPES